MPNSSERLPFGGSLAEPSPKWTQSQNKGPASCCHYCGTIPRCRNSLPMSGGHSGLRFYKRQDLGEKQESILQTSLYRQVQEGQDVQQLLKKNSVPDMSSSLYLRQMMAGRTSAPPQDYYLADVTISGQPAEESMSYRDDQHLLTRSALHYGPRAVGLNPTWDQGKAKTLLNN